MAHIKLCTTQFSPGENDNKPVQKKRFGGPNHRKDSPWQFPAAVVLFVTNTAAATKRSLQTLYLHISKWKIQLVGV